MITAIFFDAGGVLLSNGWDHDIRKRAAAQFGLDLADFERRHAGVVDDFEKGQLSLDDYLKRVVFFQARPFSADDFKCFMFEQSHADSGMLQLLAQLKASQRLLALLNNESIDLNLYRIRQFGLTRFFTVFCSSCFLRLRKPSLDIYRVAMQIVQRDPAECAFIDDRPENVEAAHECGMAALRFQGRDKLVSHLASIGVQIT